MEDVTRKRITAGPCFFTYVFIHVLQESVIKHVILATFTM